MRLRLLTVAARLRVALLRAAGFEGGAGGVATGLEAVFAAFAVGAVDCLALGGGAGGVGVGREGVVGLGGGVFAAGG